ncbi:ABC transporter substrate-binding protein [Tessaracoccus rhinocerotis]|uniref:ABC transporter substrate-binding protein n=1 Tax=Tessaracoccus rhinocerotis TaxID=1689449 RepID=A0A553JZ71_9ACTN|nr:ABC transporter substrate-binding protein [Tessaracoccus rhinocerotis]TRY17756.1 ABC transporter substrate-binding protein [Tessaracoccus rhinocerotis]
MANLRTGIAALATIAALALGACSTPADADPADSQAPAEETTAADETTEAGTVEIEDNNGTLTVNVPPTSVVALDNRTFETLAAWGVELSAAARTLMPSTNPLKDDDSIPDLGNHREPNLELIVAAEPDLIVNGQRFTDFFDDIATLAPDAVQLNLEPREGEPFDAELKRQVTVLGQVFGKEAEAEALNGEFDASIEAVRAAYTEGETVMAVNVSGGNVGYIAPSLGRTLGPLFDIFGFTPALQVDGASDDHQGDDISVEAIADANPDWILVMDRDAAVSADDPEYKPAAQVIEESAALQGVTAVAEGNIIYMPADTYTNEGIQTYTEFFNALAEAFSA